MQLLEARREMMTCARHGVSTQMDDIIFQVHMCLFALE